MWCSPPAWCIFRGERQRRSCSCRAHHLRRSGMGLCLPAPSSLPKPLPFLDMLKNIQRCASYFCKLTHVCVLPAVAKAPEELQVTRQGAELSLQETWLGSRFLSLETGTGHSPHYSRAISFWPFSLRFCSMTSKGVHGEGFAAFILVG